MTDTILALTPNEPKKTAFAGAKRVEASSETQRNNIENPEFKNAFEQTEMPKAQPELPARGAGNLATVSEGDGDAAESTPGSETHVRAEDKDTLEDLPNFQKTFAQIDAAAKRSQDSREDIVTPKQSQNTESKSETVGIQKSDILPRSNTLPSSNAPVHTQQFTNAQINAMRGPVQSAGQSSETHEGLLLQTVVKTAEQTTQTNPSLDKQASVALQPTQTASTLSVTGNQTPTTPVSLQDPRADPDPEARLAAQTPLNSEPRLGTSAAAPQTAPATVAQMPGAKQRAADISGRAEEISLDRQAAYRSEDVLLQRVPSSPVTISQSQTQAAFVSQVLPNIAAIAKVEQKAMALSEALESEANLKLEMAAVSDKPGASSATTAQSLARVDIPRHIATQLQNAVRAMPDRPIDLSLNPEELGRVRLSVAASEQGVVLSVLAERQETLDLMRKHADALAKELSELGFTSIDLAFNQGTEQEAGAQDTPDDQVGTHWISTDLKAGDTEVVSDHTGLDTTRALDIRI